MRRRCFGFGRSDQRQARLLRAAPSQQGPDKPCIFTPQKSLWLVQMLAINHARGWDITVGLAMSCSSMQDRVSLGDKQID
jgi:hypothetical protein